MILPFLSGAYEGRSPNISPQTCINYFYEKGEGAESLVSTPGDTVFSANAAGEVRGGHYYNGHAFFVVGNILYEIDSAGTATNRGTLGTSTGRVSMADNGTRSGATQELMIVDGSTNGYIYDNVTRVLTAIADPDMVNAKQVVFIDGYFVFTQTNTDRFYNTGSYDGTSISALDFYTAEGDPDKTVALVVDKRQLFLLGERTTQVYYNSGDADTLFQSFQGGYSQTGCAATFSAVRFDNSIVWLSRNERGDGQIVRLGQAFQPDVISSPEVDYQISTYNTVSDAFAYVYQHEGHEFYVLTFPTEKVTWAYDASTQKWHRRGHTIDVFPNRQRYNCHVFAFGKHLFGDYTNGDIYELDSTVGTQSGTRIPRERTSPSFGDGEKRIRLSSVQLNMQEGIGDPNSTTDTSFHLSYSKDGGHTYSNEISADAGNAGEYAKRVLWRKLGHARDWTFKVRTWTPQPHVIKSLIVRQYGE